MGCSNVCYCVYKLIALLQLLCLCGVGLSLYAAYIGAMVKVDPTYKAACDLDETIQCSMVITSKQKEHPDVFLMIRCKNTTIMLDATEETTILQLKKVIVKRPSEDIKLYSIDTNDPLEDNKTLGDCGYRSSNSKASTIGIALRKDENEFEEFEITPYSVPPELPDVMKAQDGPTVPAGLTAD